VHLGLFEQAGPGCGQPNGHATARQRAGPKSSRRAANRSKKKIATLLGRFARAGLGCGFASACARAWAGPKTHRGQMACSASNSTEIFPFEKHLNIYLPSFFTLFNLHQRVYYLESKIN